MVESSQLPWFALSVKPRHEKSVQRMLDYKGYTTALPIQQVGHTRRCGSIWQSEKPLISGYVFVAHDLQNPFHIVGTPGVIRIVSFGNTICPIPADQIEALQRVAASRLPVSNCPYTSNGQAVRLVDGPLSGLEGVVIRESGATRLVVSVDMLQRSVAVEIESAWAVPVHQVLPKAS
jgi:transcriptional antiterminator NusG